MKMVLEYIKGKFSSGFPNLDIGKISEVLKTSADIGGTTIDNIKTVGVWEWESDENGDFSVKVWAWK